MGELTKDRATKIRELHAGIKQRLQRSVEDAIEIGGLLIEQKAELAHGQWGAWVQQNVPFSAWTTAVHAPPRTA